MFLKPWLNCILLVKKAFNHLKSLVVIGSVSPRWRSQGTRRASLYFACLSIVRHVSFINKFKHVKVALYVILWILYCLGFLSIEQILFVISSITAYILCRPSCLNPLHKTLLTMGIQRLLSQVKSQELGQAAAGGSALGSLAQLTPSPCSFSP